MKLHSLALMAAGYGTLLAALSQWSLGHVASSAPIRLAGFLAVAALAGFLQIRLRGLATRISVRFFVLLLGLTMLSWPVIAFGAAAALAVVVLHRANIARLRSGTESRFRFRRTAEPLA